MSGGDSFGGGQATMRLGTVIRAWRQGAKLGVREFSAQLGTSTATLSRLERGFPVTGETLILILKWLLTAEPKPEEKA